MSALIVILIALATLAFGAVYPWGYYPLFGAAALIGAAGLAHGGLPRHHRPLALSLLAVWAAAALQLVPLPRGVVEGVSPAAATVLQTYSLGFAAADWAPLSIAPSETRTTVVALGALLLYLLGLPSLLSRRSLRALPRHLAFFVVPLALFGVYSRETQNGLIYWFWQPVEALEARASNQFGPFVNRNHYGGWMLMTLCLLVGWLVGQIERALPERGARRTRLAAWLSSAEASTIVFMTMAVFVGAMSLVWTLSRSSILALTAATAVFGLLVSSRGRLTARRRRLGVAILLAVLAAGVAWRGPVRLLEWFQDNDLAGRLDAWRDGLEVARAFPLTGTGLNTYSVAMLFYQTRNPGVYMSRAHNDYVQLLAEGGALIVVPAVVAAVVLALAIRRNLRAAAAESRGYWIRVGAAIGMLAMALQETLEFSLQIPVNALLFCTLAAVALMPATSASAGARGPRDNIRERTTGSHVPLSQV